MSKVLIKKSSDEADISLNSYELKHHIETGVYQNSWVLGYLEEERKGFFASLGKTFESVVKEASPLNMRTTEVYSVEIREPQNMAYIGVAGTGKSMAMISALTMRFCTNSNQDIYLLSQPNLKSDYEPFFSFKENVSISLGEKCCQMIRPSFDELKKRIRDFEKLNVKTLSEYESVEESLAKVFIVIIDFNSFYLRLKNDPELTALFLEVVKRGNDYGIYCIISNEEIHKVPDEILSSFKTINLFTLDRKDSDSSYLENHKERKFTMDYLGKGSFFSDKNEQLKTFSSSRNILSDVLNRYNKPLETTFLSREITRVLGIKNGLKSKVRRLQTLLRID